MDESPYPSSSHSMYARNAAGRDVSNLLDESLDFRNTSSAGLGDEDDFGSQQGSSTRTVRGGNAPLQAIDVKGKGRLQDGDSQEPLEELAGGVAAVSLQVEGANTQAEGSPTLKQGLPTSDDLPTVPPLSSEQRRENALIRERDDLARMNTMLESALKSLEGAIPKIEVDKHVYLPRSAYKQLNRCLLQRMESTIANTHALMDTYVKVLSQTEHTQQLLLDEDWEWQKDLDEMQEEEEAAIRAQQEEEERIAREAREEEERQAKEREEAERRAYMAANPPARGKGTTRGTRGIATGRGRIGVSSRGTTRGTTSTVRGRGTSSTRGIARGLS